MAAMDSILWNVDPTVSLNDIFFHSFSFLDHQHLTRCSRVSREWKDISYTDSLWAELCDRVWSNKVHISQQFKEMKEKHKAREALKLSVIDSKRTHVTLEELTSLSWRFRFKQRAGPGWTDDDPYWNNEEPIRRRFLEDGRMVFDLRCDEEVKEATSRSYARFGQSQTEPRVERVARMSETYMSMFAPEDDDDQHPAPQTNSDTTNDDEEDDVSPLQYSHNDDGSSSTRRRFERMQRSMNFRWRFVQQHANSPEGSAIQVNQFPAYTVSRHTGNWGFIMQSVWVFMASFDLLKPGEDPQMDDNNLQRSQMAEMMAYNWGVPIDFILTLAQDGGLRNFMEEGDDDSD